MKQAFTRNYLSCLHCWEANDGRDSGWLIEFKGTPFARLTDPQFQEMFWDSYRFEFCTDDPEMMRRAQTDTFWCADSLAYIRWRSLLTGEVVHALPCAKPFTDEGRFIVRGLYLDCRPPNFFDQIVLFLRRRFFAARE